MAAQNPPSFMQQVATETAAEARALIQALVPGAGVVGGGDLKVAQHSTPNMSVDIAPGAAFVLGTSTSTQGMYHVWTDTAITTLTIAAADPTNPRIDTVIAQVQDAFYTGSTNAWQLAVLTGTPTGGATLGNLNGAAAVPVSSLVLGYILVPATSTSVVNANISDARVPAGYGESAGVIQIFAGSTAPAGWLLCQGQSVSTTTYAGLFSVIGYTYGGGGASFNLPDLRGRSPIGVGSVGTNSQPTIALAGNGGEQNHQLSVAELAQHNHSHSHSITFANSNPDQFVGSGGTNSPPAGSNWDSRGASIGTDATNTGSNTAHNNMHPYLGLNFIIKF